MITQTFPSKIKPLLPPPIVGAGVYQHKGAPWYTPTEIQQANMRKITPQEYVRREEVIRQKALACPFKIGDTVFPADRKDYEKYGAFLVSGVLASYKDTATDHEWAKGDNPLIVTLRSLKDGNNVMFCTSTWLTKTNLHLVIETAV